MVVRRFDLARIAAASSATTTASGVSFTVVHSENLLIRFRLVMSCATAFALRTQFSES
jgi:hypothetical protein